MPSEDSFADLMTRLQAGNDQAAPVVVHRFTHRLIALARGRLDVRLRQKIDPEDVLQSVYKSFFLRQAEGRLILENWQGLWRVLAAITVHKCGRWAKHFHALKRDVKDEAAGDDVRAGLEFLSDEPSPEEAVHLAELVEGLLRDLGQRDSEILTLALQGHSADEISDQLNRPPRTVYRVLKRIKDSLQRLE